MNENNQQEDTPENTQPEPISTQENTPNPDNSPKEKSAEPTNDYKEDKKEPEVIDTPEWFMKDKFKTVEDQAKSYKDLSSKLGKFWGTPSEGYKVDGIEGLTADDPLIASIAPALQEIGLSQDGFQALVSKYIEANKSIMSEMESELKKTLTTTDAHTYQAITKWMDDSLTPDEANQIKNNWLMTADDFKLFNNLRLMLAPSTNVPTGNANAVKYESSKEVTNDKIKYRKELKSGTRVQDKNYEDELASRFRDAAARELRSKAR